MLAEYAPNVPSAIEHRQVLSPLDLERAYGITGGNIMQGAMSPHQLYCFRPVAGWADHRTPVPGLYLCGAASHPGGGVMGACGKNAATEILRDKRRGRGIRGQQKPASRRRPHPRAFPPPPTPIPPSLTLRSFNPPRT